MNYTFLYLILLLFISYCSFGQVLPEPGAILHQTQIMIEHESVKNADEYIVQLTEDIIGYKFEHPDFEHIDSSTATIVGNLHFGKKYLWRYTGLKHKKQFGWKGPYRFEISNDTALGDDVYRVRVLQNDSLNNGGGLIVVDEIGRIIDRHGNFVWYLPQNNDTTHLLGNRIIDLRITPSGTITFLRSREAFECDLNGKVLWTAPQANANKLTAEFVNEPFNYHHTLKKLANGNYMVLAERRKPLTAFTMADSLKSKEKDLSIALKPDPLESGYAETGYVSEFDKSGKLIWMWDSKDYFKTDYILNLKPDSGIIAQDRGAHLNSFDVDEKHGIVYLSFRNASQILKIDKKTGNVLYSWGSRFGLPTAAGGDVFFYKQHGLMLLKDGSIGVFNNNNFQQEDTPSSVVIFSSNFNDNTNKVLFKFDCNFSYGGFNKSLRGGNVEELENGNLLVCMGTINRVFEVTREKEVVWNALFEKRTKSLPNWSPQLLGNVHYSSSLYPCYFTVQIDKKIIGKLDTSFTLKIFNDGTENDSYNISLSSSPSGYQKRINSFIIQSRKSASFEIIPDGLISSAKGIEIAIKSNTNPNYKRTISIAVDK